MNQGMEENNIEQLKNLKLQLKWWRWGVFGVSLLIVIGCVDTIAGAVKGLATKGPRQEKFVKELSEGLQTEVVPMLEQMAGQTMSEVRPDIERAFQQVNNRVPEMAQATLSQFDTLQANLPKRGDAVLTRTFGDMLAKKEESLQAMFPEATEEQIERLLTNLGESATEQVNVANLQLFERHQAALERIHENLDKISQAEASKIAHVDPTWEMGLLVLDIFRADLEQIRPDKSALLAAKTQSQPMKQGSTKMVSAKVVKKSEGRK